MSSEEGSEWIPPSTPSDAADQEVTSGAGPSRSRWMLFLKCGVGWTLALAGKETATAAAPDVNMAFGREVEVACPCVGKLASGIAVGLSHFSGGRRPLDRPEREHVGF